MIDRRVCTQASTAAPLAGLLPGWSRVVVAPSRARGLHATVKASSNGTDRSSSRTAWKQTMASVNAELVVPISLMTDSYKASHFLQYPEARRMVAVRSPSSNLASHACL